MQNKRKLKQIVSNGKPDDISLEKEIESLEFEVRREFELITDFYDRYMTNDYDDEAIAEIYRERVSFDLPDIHDLIKTYYPDYRHSSGINDKDELYAAIAESINYISQEHFRFKGILPEINNPLYISIKEMYPDPKDFIADYEALRSLQKEDAKPAVFWLGMIIMNAYDVRELYLYKKTKEYIKKYANKGWFREATSVMQATKEHIRRKREYANI